MPRRFSFRSSDFGIRISWKVPERGRNPERDRRAAALFTL